MRYKINLEYNGETWEFSVWFQKEDTDWEMLGYGENRSYRVVFHEMRRMVLKDKVDKEVKNRATET